MGRVQDITYQLVQRLCLSPMTGGEPLWLRPKHKGGLRWEGGRGAIRCRAGNRCWEGRLPSFTASHQLQICGGVRNWIVASGPMAFSLTQTSPSEWKYISEGAATAVFSYSGPHHPILTGRVLRLRKVPRDGHPHSVSDDNPMTFQQSVVSRLLDPSYLPDLQTIPLQSDWVEALSIHHESFRPQERRSASVIDCTRQTGVLASDLIGGLSCAVEVKVNNNYLPKIPIENFS
jgi:hypothetical protein